MSDALHRVDLTLDWQPERSMGRFSGKVAVVTGGGSGIGAAAARRFAAEGAAVVVADIDEAAAQSVASALSASGARALALRVDVSDESHVAAMADRAVSAFGGLDVMVNNAGVGGVQASIDTVDLAVWQRIIDVNLTGVFLGLKHAVRVMRAAGKPGVIVNIASILGHVGFANAAAYTASKHGVLGLTKAAALELGAEGYRVVAVAPAFIKTPMIAGMEEGVAPLHALGRIGTPEEVAALIAFLAADEASFLTGASYLVDGGYVAR
jgi:NAD(P)-dependent dehydrogenase (short-subunit alcohol dehydrogenase family)